MSINKLRKNICTCLNGPHDFLPEVSEQASHILCENCIQTCVLPEMNKKDKNP